MEGVVVGLAALGYESTEVLADTCPGFHLRHGLNSLSYFFSIFFLISIFSKPY